MAGADGVDDLRNRAKALVNETTRPYNTLLQALPGLLLLANQYRTAAENYRTIHLRQRDILALQRIEELAQKRYRLMQERYFTSQRSINSIKDIRFANGSIAFFQFWIAAGKLAEMYLSAGKWAKLVSGALDEAKFLVDGAKSVGGVVEGARSGDATTINATAAQVASLRLRLDPELANLSKVIWDAASSVRRFNSVREWSQHLSAVLNAVKAVVDQLAVFAELIKRDATHFKEIGRGLGIIRDLVDAGRAIYRAVEACQAYWRTFEAMDMAVEEAARYLGEGHVMALDANVRFAEIDPAIVVAEARSVGAAQSLAAATKEASNRIHADITALDGFLWLQVARINSALRDLRPHLEAIEHCLNRLGSQIANLRFVIKGGGPRALAVQPIHDALVGYQTHVNALYLQVQGILFPSLPQLRDPDPLPSFEPMQ